MKNCLLSIYFKNNPNHPLSERERKRERGREKGKSLHILFVGGSHFNHHKEPSLVQCTVFFFCLFGKKENEKIEGKMSHMWGV